MNYGLMKGKSKIRKVSKLFICRITVSTIVKTNIQAESL